MTESCLSVKLAPVAKTETVAREKYTITGKVTEDSGEPIIGANVIVKGTTNGMMTDINGNFHLEVTDKKVTLLVSYIGYTSQEVVATPDKAMNIILKVDNNLLEEVIVTGYGTFKKSAYAGSASIVKTDAVERCAQRLFPADVGRCGSRCQCQYRFGHTGFVHIYPHPWYGFIQCL